MSRKPVSKKLAPPPYGYRRTWYIEWPPAVGTGSPAYPRSQRLHGRGPRLESFPPQAARVDPHLAALGSEVRYWGEEPTSNWDLYPASILLSVSASVFGKTSLRRNEYTAAARCLRGPRSGRLGMQYMIHGLVTRGRDAGHKQQRAALAAALRDAADLLDGPHAGAALRVVRGGR